MGKEITNWAKWRRFFAARCDRALPELDDTRTYSDLPSSVADSLAIFQLGESGGGTVIEQARQSQIRSIDDDYAGAMAFFVAEEHRHAEILAICVRNLRGTLIRSNWTARLFVFARRLIGLRLKVVVLLAAEVVGICYYHLLASRLPRSRLKSLLAQLVNDERAHLHFHCDFLRSQAGNLWRRVVFKAVWRTTMMAAAVVVMIDHRRAIRDLDIGFRNAWHRWMTYSRLAECLITARNPADMPELGIPGDYLPAQSTTNGRADFSGIGATATQ